MAANKPPSDDTATNTSMEQAPMGQETPSPSLSSGLSDQDVADLREELRQARAERTRQAAQLETMQRQLEAANRQSGAPQLQGPYQAPAWAGDHADELVSYLVRHGDQPRGAVVDLPGDLGMLLGVRNAYFLVDAGHIAAVPLQWSDLSD